MGSIWPVVVADLINWGWLRIGPPYIYINIDPVIVHLGPLALHWYGLMYVVAIVVALWGIQGYIRRKGLNDEIVYRLLWWCIIAGLIGGRLYFVIQQPDLVQGYLLQPWRILATWEGGMAFYGAIFLVVPVLFWRARVEGINPFVALDSGVLFASIGQIFGRIGNLINGDIIGYPSTLPWSTVYVHPSSFACLQGYCNVPVQPAAAYEMLCNIVLLAVLYVLSRRLRRPGVLTLAYLYGYAITQFIVFFWRANLVVSFLGLDWGLKQAQWTSLVVLILLLPATYLVLRSRYARPVPPEEVAAFYGMPPRPGNEAAATAASALEEASGEPERAVSASALSPTPNTDARLDEGPAANRREPPAEGQQEPS
ncbi:prolipoprotein diacylglyceryl transferase [Thermogemmatispora onikobensis]|uniref:prolipoprotein diacylglyceryl transferase n=1 Tax=Thermogemmatispora onikobensis TaxID=732234 RepID=UPI0008535911|nr:prolipoprotein diacylglyceryl transferase [Thermogemmatispora onikobensis]